MLYFQSFAVARPGPEALRLEVVGQGGLGYPMDKHTDLVGRDTDPVAASDLTARLKRPAMVKPPRYKVQEVEVVGMGRMMPFAWAKLPIPPTYPHYGVTPPTRGWFTGPATTYWLHSHGLVPPPRSMRLDTTDVVGCAQACYLHQKILV